MTRPSSTTSTIFALLCLTSTAFAAACGGASGQGDTTSGSSRVPSDLVRMLPPEAVAVLRVDAASLRQSPYYDLFWSTASQRGERENQALLRRVIDETSVVVLGVVPAPDPSDDPEVLVFFAGDYSGSVVDDFGRAVGGGNTQRRPIRDTYAYAAGGSPPDGLLRIDDDHWFIGRSSRHEAILDRLDRGGASPRDVPAFVAAAQAAGFDSPGTVRFVGYLDDGLRALARSSVAEGGIPQAQELASSLQSGGAHIDLSNGIHLEILAVLSSASAASAIADRIRTKVQELISSPLMMMLSLGDALQNLRIEARGATIVVDLVVSDATVRSMVDRFGSQRGGRSASTSSAP